MEPTINNNGIGATYATFFCDEDMDEDTVESAVCLYGSNRVTEGIPNRRILGRLEYKKGNICAVQILGITKFKLDPNNSTPIIYPNIDYTVRCGHRGTVCVVEAEVFPQGAKFLGLSEDGFVSVLL